MATWPDFATAAPLLATAIQRLLYQYGPGLAYLATVRRDGAPRIHPVSPVITDEGLFCFVMPSPKRHDLDRDGRYALHAYPPDDSDDEACLTGRAHRVTDQLLTRSVAGHARAADGPDWRLYELTIDLAHLVHRPAAAAPTHTVWRSDPRHAPKPRQNHPCASPVDSVQ